MGERGEEFILEVAVEGAKFLFRDGGIRYNLEHGTDKMMRAALVTAQSMAPEVENWMKVNAPWEDQTGNARNGLTARAYREGDEVGIELAHSVFYGIFLETRFSGRYAVIQPAIDEMGPRVMRRYDRLLERM